MSAKSHSFSTKTDIDTVFVDTLRINERRNGRANFSWVVIQALKEYAQRIDDERKLLEETKNG